MRRVVVERVDAHGLLVTQGTIINVQHSIDEYICATCVTTHAHGCIHRMLTYELVSSPCNSINSILIAILTASAAA